MTLNIMDYSLKWRLTPVSIIILICSLLICSNLYAERATRQEMAQVCENWLSQVVFKYGNWAEINTPVIGASHELWHDEMFLGMYYDIQPAGFIIIPVLKEMSPIKAYSDKSSLDSNQEQGFILLIKEVLASRLKYFQTVYGSLDARQDEFEDDLFAPYLRTMWDDYAQPNDRFVNGLSVSKTLLTEAGPLCTSSWFQREPYYNYCPIDCGGRCVVGCTATAMAQILYYWQWPLNGHGSHTYTWYDITCGGNPIPYEITADFSDDYDWPNMVDSCLTECTPGQIAAMAELNHEVGVSINMAYSSSGSGADFNLMSYILDFKYSGDMSTRRRVDYDLDGWFGLIREEIDNNRPIQYGILLHSIVCDGYRDHGGGVYEFHMNYGWGGNFTAWYFLDNLYCSWVIGDVCPYEQEIMLIGIEPATKPHIYMQGCSLIEAVGDGDGRADPGETINADVTVYNIGTEAENTVGELTSSDPYLTIITSTTSYDTYLPHGGQSTGITPFVLSVSEACPDPYVGMCEFSVTFDGGITVSDSIYLFVGDTPGFTDNMENGPAKWRHKSLTIGRGDEWHLESYQVHDGAACWKAGGLGADNYGSMQDGCLMTLPFLLPQNAELTFWHWIASEPGSPGTAFDGGAVMISVNNGEWIQIFPEGGYPTVRLSYLTDDLPVGSLCYGESIDWAQETFDLSEYSGVARIMFRFGSDGNVGAEGWYIDDVSIHSSYICGDANDDDAVNVGDVVYLVNLIFHNGPLPASEAAGDANCDGDINVGDAVYLANYVFQPDAPEPCATTR